MKLGAGLLAFLMASGSAARGNGQRVPERTALAWSASIVTTGPAALPNEPTQWSRRANGGWSHCAVEVHVTTLEPSCAGTSYARVTPSLVPVNAPSALRQERMPDVDWNDSGPRR